MARVTATLLLCAIGFVFGSVSDNETEDHGKHWVLIVAGSSGWGNYRHQADICHAYQIMRRNGIPAERIVTMMADDIAHNRKNPTPGVIINHPNGSDVYAGVVIDYRGDDVTPENFLAILQGNADAMRGKGSGKVINSGPDDHVFVNFADHGAPGLVAFPRGMLHARKLKKAIEDMNDQKKYKQMVLYIEACESGSMFEELPQNIAVFATTAANSHESSFACYYDKRRRTYLGDVYSVKWMEDSDAENLQQETLEKQFVIVRNETKTSHVMQFGDMSISLDVVADFQGKPGKYEAPEAIRLPKAPLNAVASEEVPLAILRHKLLVASDVQEELQIINEMREILETREAIEKSMRDIVKWATGHSAHQNMFLEQRRRLTNYDCYESVVEYYNKRCFNLPEHDFALRRLYVLVNLCEEMIATDNIKSSIDVACTLP